MRAILTTKVAVLGSVTLLGAVGAGVYVHQRGEAPASVSVDPESALRSGDVAGADAPIDTPTAEEKALPPPEVSTTACSFRKGEVRAWAIGTKVDATLDGNVVAAATMREPLTVSETHAIFQIEVLSDTAAGDDAREPSAVVLASFDEVDPQTARRVGDMRRPFLLRVGGDCTVTAFARERTTPIVTARTEQALSFELAFAVPRETSTSFHGRDGMGTYLANVGVGKDERGDFVRRRVLSYPTVWSKEHGKAVRVERSTMTVRRDAGLWFQSIQGEQTILGNGVSKATSTLKVGPTSSKPERLKDASRDPGAYIWEDLLDREVTLFHDEPLSAAEKAERDRLKSVPLDEAFRRFEANAATHKNINDQWRGLSTYIEARPEMIPRLRVSLRNNVLPADERAGAFLALGMARVPEARDALVAINSDVGTSPANRAQCALLLANRKDVGLPLAQQLRKDAVALTAGGATFRDRSYARTALLALGMMAGVHKETIPEMVAEARGAISSALLSGKTPEDLSPAFGAMGNVGDVDAIPDVLAWSHNANPEIRELVPRAIRRMPFKSIHGLVVEWLARETYPGVKRTMYQMLHGIVLDQKVDVPGDLIAQAITDLAKQPDVFTRQSIVRILGPLAQTNPVVAQSLVSQAKLEAGTSSGIYTMIAQYVPGPALAAALTDSNGVVTR